LTEKLQLDGDARHEGEQNAGGDDANGGLDRSLFGQSKPGQQRSQIADILGGILPIKPYLVKRSARAGFCGAFEQAFEITRRHRFGPVTGPVCIVGHFICLDVREK
jgi:hypothetical protein